MAARTIKYCPNLSIQLPKNMTEKYFIQSVKFSKQFYLIIKLAKEKEPSLAATMKIQYG